MTIREQTGPRGYPLDPEARGSALFHGILREWEKDERRAARYRDALIEIRDECARLGRAVHIAEIALRQEGEE